jgi:hypothetical protein
MSPNDQLVIKANIVKPSELMQVLNRITETMYLYVEGEDWIATHAFLGIPYDANPFDPDHSRFITWLDSFRRIRTPDNDMLEGQLLKMGKRIFIRGHLIMKAATAPIWSSGNTLIFTQHTMCMTVDGDKILQNSAENLLLPTIVRKTGDNFRLEIVPCIIEKTYRLSLSDELGRVIGIFNRLSVADQSKYFLMVKSLVGDYLLGRPINENCDFITSCFNDILAKANREEPREETPESDELDELDELLTYKI